jgi:hypothetical protein
MEAKRVNLLEDDVLRRNIALLELAVHGVCHILESETGDRNDLAIEGLIQSYYEVKNELKQVAFQH